MYKTIEEAIKNDARKIRFINYFNGIDFYNLSYEKMLLISAIISTIIKEVEDDTKRDEG